MDRIDTPSAVPLLSQPVWLRLSQEMRGKLVNLFGLKRSGATETYMGRDSMVRVVSDGYTASDLLAVSKERMQELLGSDSTDFYWLFDEVCANVESLLDGSFLQTDIPNTLLVPSEDKQRMDLPIVKKRGRPKKK